MNKLRIYLDTSVINFLFADDAPEKRDATRKFFDRHLPRYEAAVSAVVVGEISKTKDVRQRDRLLNAIRQNDLKELPIEPFEEVTVLANVYVVSGVIPKKKYEDALHVALCTVKEMDVLVSWNFEHLANVNKERKILAVNHANGYFYPLRITTPLEVMDDE